MWKKFTRSSMLLSLLLLASTAATRGANAAPVVVDLSLDFEVAADNNNSEGAQTVLDMAALNPLIRTVLVLEHGQIVAEYVREDVNAAIPNQVWSATKSWMSLMVGLMIEQGLVSLEETLGEIFDDPATWEAVSELDNNNSSNTEFRRAVTLRELLSMASGLVNPPPPAEDEEEIVFWDNGNLGGSSLAGSLAHPAIGTSKSFEYLLANNILSYIVQQRTNSTPREYLAAHVLPQLGIANDDIDWWKNEDQVEYAYHGMLLTPYQMAKFGQLYLQGGKSNATTQLVDAEWIATSSSSQSGNPIYGYLIWVFPGALLGNPELGTISCAQGLGGQDICMSPVTDRVIVQQRDLPQPTTDDTDNNETATAEEDEDDGFETLEIVGVALNPDLLFTTDATTETTDAGNPDAEINSAAPVLLSSSHHNLVAIVSFLVFGWIRMIL